MNSLHDDIAAAILPICPPYGSRIKLHHPMLQQHRLMPPGQHDSLVDWVAGALRFCLVHGTGPIDVHLICSACEVRVTIDYDGGRFQPHEAEIHLAAPNVAVQQAGGAILLHAHPSFGATLAAVFTRCESCALACC